MPNPLYNEMMELTRPETNNGFSQMMNQLNSFAQTLRGNPKQIVEQMIQSGQMTQAQYNQIAQEANKMIGMMQRTSGNF